jgi:hypothetical protein
MTEIYDVTVLLSEDFRCTCFGYNPSAPYKEAAKLRLASPDSVQEACDLVWEICNSYPTPEEMHCSWSLLDVVRTYREAGNRSLSVGDALRVDGVLYAVAPVGFVEVYQEPPTQRQITLFCLYCNRVMSTREAAEQGACNDCYEVQRGSHVTDV